MSTSKSIKNIHGLARSIPSEIKREVRQRDNFGCILCAFPIVQYEHVDPLFCDAKEHLASGITLLCPTCHAKVTNGFISKELIKEAMKNPMAEKIGKVSDTLLFTKEHPTVKIGGATFEKCNIILEFLRKEIFSVTYENDHYFINAKFWDSNGKHNLAIVNNEWQVETENVWDLEVVGNTVTVREKYKKPTLIFSFENNNLLIIDKIDMNVMGFHILGNKEVLLLNNNRLNTVSIRNCRTGISILS
ncbi:HNH endonuclease [Acinetobacter pittii]|uniref:HNH endonuclease n=1 Tax=Acinetobacter pittii TaxID=48296 RepID=UPI0024DEE8EF|nr:HNH endonuclease [Acinetobacter pittii]